MAKSSSQKANVDYERIGRLVFSISELGAKDKKTLYKISFWRGVWGGLGGVIGATIIVAMLLWIFSLLGDVPLIGPVIDLIRKKIAEPI